MTVRGRFMALTYDRQMRKVERAGLRAFREQVLADARCDLLEIGAGTGANLDIYGPAVTSLTLTEPDTVLIRRLTGKARDLAPHARVLRAPAEDLPFEAGSFDTVVSTLVLCGVSDQQRALREARRVLRPGGRLLFVEHVRGDDARTIRTQNRMNGLNRFVGGCECIRPTLDSIQEAGFDVVHVEHVQVQKVPSWIRPVIVGSATSPARAASDAKPESLAAAAATIQGAI